MEKSSLDLMGILLTVSIFIPVVFEILFGVYSDTDTGSIELSLLFFPATCLISYSFIYARNLEDKLTKLLIVINLYLLGFVILWISLMPTFSKSLVPQFVRQFQDFLFIFSLLIMPFIILLYTAFFYKKI